MWNPPQGSDPHADEPTSTDSASADEYSDPADDPYAAVSWTPDQLARLENEWRRLQSAFAYHPHVTLTPLVGDPPSAYQIDYRLTTVTVSPQTQQLEYVANATLQIHLPPGFPQQPPIVRPVSALFHPNVSYEGVYLAKLWHPNETLLALVMKLGDLLAYRPPYYDREYAVNASAIEWADANFALFPIDRQSNLHPTAGGEPLTRICKFGPPSLEAMKQSMTTTQTALLGQSPPEPAALRDYARKTRLALNLFLEANVPDELQARASELDEASRELITTLPLYEFARERKKLINSTRQLARQLKASNAPLAAEVDKLAALVDAGDPEEPMVALKLIPDAATLQPLQFSLPKLVAEAQKRIASIRAGVAALAKLRQPMIIAPDSFLGQKLEQELAAGAIDDEAVKKEAAETLAGFESTLHRAVAEAQALAAAARWREYMDMAAKAKSMEKQIRQWGAEGLQAYYIENAGGRYGPFQFEQPVDLGGGDLVVRSLGGKAMELRDPAADKALATSQIGEAELDLPAGEQEFGAEPSGPTSFKTSFSVTDRCEDLMVLLEFLRRQAIDTVQKFAAYEGDATSWAGKVCRLLARPEVKKGLEEELARAARRWRHTIVDLSALGPFKERLATYFLLERVRKSIPELVRAITDRKARYAASKQKVADILSRCGHDPETGRPIIPSKLAKPYAAETALQAECEDTVRRSQSLLKSLLTQLTNRLNDPKLLGRGAPIQLRAVAPLPPELTQLRLADGWIGNRVLPLSQMLKIDLGGPAADPTLRAAPPPVAQVAAEQADEAGVEAPVEAADVEQPLPVDAHATDDPESQYAATTEPAATLDSAEAIESAEALETGWAVHEEEEAQYTEDQYEQTDVVFGFDPDSKPSPPTRGS